MGIPPRNMCQKVPCNVSNLLMHLCCDCFFVFPMSSSVKKIPFFAKLKFHDCIHYYLSITIAIAI